MKKFFKKIIDTALNFFRWVWGECHDWRTFLLLAIICIIIGTPVWGGYLLFILFGWKWAAAVATTVLAFWWIPGMPFFAVAVSITLAIKRFGRSFFDRTKKKSKKTPPSESKTDDKTPESSDEAGKVD